MKIFSWNVNGIRAVERKGELQSFLNTHDPDILFIQETKAKKEQLSAFLTEHEIYSQHYYSAEKAGYSGVALWYKKELFSQVDVQMGMAGWSDKEGRIISLHSPQLIVYGIYFPNGGKSPEAWQEKILFYEHFLKHIHSVHKKNSQPVIWCGDLNVAHNEIDLARPKENEKNIGFLPEERNWVNKVILKDWVDVFRNQHKERVSYTWWSMQTRARRRNVGWRIDYFFMHQLDMKLFENSDHHNEQEGSDHCPISLQINLE